MSNIKFYIPNGETIPTDLRLYVDDVYVVYERTIGGYLFRILLDDEERAMEVAKQIVERMEYESYNHGASWRTISLEVVPQEERYKVGTVICYKYRVRDSY